AGDQSQPGSRFWRNAAGGPAAAGDRSNIRAKRLGIRVAARAQPYRRNVSHSRAPGASPMSPRDQRALAILAVAVVVGAVYEFCPPSDAPKVVAPTTGSVALIEKRLQKLRETAATVPAKETILKQVSSDLASREKGLITADTAAQAQAQLIQIFRRIGGTENPPIEIRNTEIGPVRPLGEAYGE